jgi:glycosyltransferase involved in cell wall biosynthesis
MINITVIVRDRPRLTEQCLRSIRNTLVEGTVTILDDGSLDPTMEICQAYVSIPHPSLKFHLVRNVSPTGGAGAARNQCIQVSIAKFGKGDLLYCSDNDVFFERGWLERLTASWKDLTKYHFGLLGGCQHPYHGPLPGGIHDFGMPCYDSGVEENYTLPSQSWLMTWETWETYGPLEEHKGVRQSEDWKFTEKLRAIGLKIGHLKYNSPVIACSKTDTFGELIPGAELIQSYPGVICE